MSTPEGDRGSEIINAPRPADQFAVDTREGVADMFGHESSPHAFGDNELVEAIDAGTLPFQTTGDVTPKEDQEGTYYPDLELTTDLFGPDDSDPADSHVSHEPIRRSDEFSTPSSRPDGDRGPRSKRADQERKSQRGLKLERRGN